MSLVSFSHSYAEKTYAYYLDKWHWISAALDILAFRNYRHLGAKKIMQEQLAEVLADLGMTAEFSSSRVLCSIILFIAQEIHAYISS